MGMIQEQLLHTHVCNQIMFPRVSLSDTEEAFKAFTVALKTVIGSPLTFNMV